MTFSRRAVLAAGLALAGCRKGPANTAQAAVPEVPPLSQVTPFPLGAEIVAEQLDDPTLTRLLLANFNQVTCGLEMKMERILRTEGQWDFAEADRIMDFARANSLRVHGHTLIWYIDTPPAFARVKANPAAFDALYADYIRQVAGRWAGRIAGWDVVNEPVNEDGSGYRDCLWTQGLGLVGHVEKALRHAKVADPSAVLFVNEYNLEINPRKRDAYRRLIEDVLKTGAPLEGIGTQMHLRYDLAEGAITACIKDLAQYGLPLHISELDISTRAEGQAAAPMNVRLERQAALVAEAVQAFRDLPPRQRYAITMWGVRDTESWLRQPHGGGDKTDSPLLFDDANRPKPAAAALVKAAVG